MRNYIKYLHIPTTRAPIPAFAPGEIKARPRNPAFPEQPRYPKPPAATGQYPAVKVPRIFVPSQTSGNERASTGE